jgi:predicted RNA-binding Zn-ribbon protein involved in translation (DUF1610 family)
MEFQSRLPDDAACRAYLFASRWPEGFRCPACGSERATELPKRLLWQCAACRHQVSVTAGTMLHSGRVYQTRGSVPAPERLNGPKDPPLPTIRVERSKCQQQSRGCLILSLPI